MAPFFVLRVMCAEVERSRGEPGAAHVGGRWLSLTSLTLGSLVFVACSACVLRASFVAVLDQTTYQGLRLPHRGNPRPSCCYMNPGAKSENGVC